MKIAKLRSNIRRNILLTLNSRGVWISASGGVSKYKPYPTSRARSHNCNCRDKLAEKQHTTRGCGIFPRKVHAVFLTHPPPNGICRHTSIRKAIDQEDRGFLRCMKKEIRNIYISNSTQQKVLRKRTSTGCEIFPRKVNIISKCSESR